MKGFGSVTIETLGYARLCSKPTIQLADGECSSFSQVSRAAKRRGGASSYAKFRRTQHPIPPNSSTYGDRDEGCSQVKRAATKRQGMFVQSYLEARTKAYPSQIQS